MTELSSGIHDGVILLAYSGPERTRVVCALFVPCAGWKAQAETTLPFWPAHFFHSTVKAHPALLGFFGVEPGGEELGSTRRSILATVVNATRGSDSGSHRSNGRTRI